MIEPYTAVGLIPTFWGARRRADISKNLEHLGHLARAAVMLSSLDIPVRLIAIPEGALQGFNDEVTDVDHVNMPGPARSTSQGLKLTPSAALPASMAPLSWRKPKQGIRTGRICSSTSGS
jgi:hypothetical protein